jgi:hypothetical protein
VLTTVVFDVGETLVDETRQWAGWARWLAVPELTLFAVLGGLVARGVDHRELVPLLKPGATFDAERTAKEAAGQGWAELDATELYPTRCRACARSGTTGGASWSGAISRRRSSGWWRGSTCRSTL